MRLSAGARSWVAVVGLASLVGGVETARAHDGHAHAPSLPQGSVQRIAFGSCARQWEPQPIWKAVAAAEPDLFIFLGDAVYADKQEGADEVATEKSLRGAFAALAANEEFRAFSSVTPIVATWDDHDYGKNDGGAEYPLKQVSKQIFLDFFGEPAGSQRRRTPGISDAVMLGPPGRRVQILLLDGRSFRGPLIADPRPREVTRALGLLGRYVPNLDPNATFLGEDQWRWLEGELRKPAELRLLVSGLQVIAGEKGKESWANLPLERRRLYDLIAGTRASGVIILSGDVHFAELSRTEDGPYPLLDFTSSGLTHTRARHARALNSHRIAGAFTEPNFGLIEIDWDARPHPAITLRSLGLEGQIGFTHTLSLGDLRSTDD